MSTDIISAPKSDLVATGKKKQYMTMSVDNQLFGLPVTSVRDALKKMPVTPIPLAPPEIAGAMNLRGRIVTVIDMRRRLNLPSLEGEGKTMKVVVEHEGESFSLVIDTVGEVLALDTGAIEPNPANLSEKWAAVSSGVYRLKDTLIIILDIDSVLDF